MFRIITEIQEVKERKGYNTETKFFKVSVEMKNIIWENKF